MHPPTHSFLHFPLPSKKNEAQKNMLQNKNTFAFLAVHHHMNIKLKPQTEERSFSPISPSTIK